MANFTITRADLFPNGTSVSVYPTTAVPTGHNGPPLATAIDTQTMSGGSLTFSGLTEDTDYVASAKIDGDWRHLYFRADSASDVLIYRDSNGNLAETDFSTFARSLLDDGDAGTMRGTIDAAQSSHTHPLSQITDAGTAAALDAPASGDAASGEVVKGDDSRMTDARTPTSHAHTLSDVTDSGTAAALNVPASGDAASGEVVKGDDSRLGSLGGFSAPEFRSVSTGTWSASTSQATSLPSDWEAGDLALLHIHADGQDLTWLTESDEWHQIMMVDDLKPAGSPDGRASLFARLLEAGDTAPTINTDNSSEGAWAISLYSGCDADRPWEGRSWDRTAAGSDGTDHPILSTALGPARRFVTFLSHDPETSGQTATPPPGFIERYDVAQAATNHIAAADMAGDLLEHQPRWTSSESDEHSMLAIALVPSGDGANTLISHDDCSESGASDVKDLWGSIDAQVDSRVTHSASGGPNGKPYRRIEVQDGDDVTGERAEIGNNNHRHGFDGRQAVDGTNYPDYGTFQLFFEGQKYLTRIWYRLPASFPLSAVEWQLVMQMKETQVHGTVDAGIFSMQAREGSWILFEAGTANSEIHRETAQVDTWTLHEFEIVYSQDPLVGHVIWRIGDENTDPAEVYSGSHQTLKADNSGSTYLAAGQSIPAHLRVGVYHNPVIAGTHVDVADIRVYAA